MKTEVETAIKLLAGKITQDVKADDALKFTQAALNLAHVDAIIFELQARERNQGTLESSPYSEFAKPS